MNEKLKPYYDRYDKAFETNDIRELAYLNQFANDVDIRKWDREFICKSMAEKDGVLKKGEKEFYINDCGVVTNPNVLSFVDKRCKAMIETAPIDGKWYNGCSFMDASSGFASGVSKCGSAFDTEKEAVADVAKRGMEWFAQRSAFIVRELKALTQPQLVQLSLFDF